MKVSYAVDKGVEIKSFVPCDVVIAGMGAAGLYAALNLDKKLNVVILGKMGQEESNSIYAQGGIASITLENDSYSNHIEDTLKAGAGLCKKEAVDILVKEGPKGIKNLIKMGVPFDRDKKNNLCITKEGAHSFNRILHCGGDATGFHLTKTLIENVKKRDNIKIVDNTFIIDIIKDKNGKAAGVITRNKQLDTIVYEAPNVILATGGIGRLYRNSTNSISSTGDGIATAIRAGAEVDNMEFVQFHPTALIHPDSDMRYFLISEALRGEGAVLKNRKGERFMLNHHPMAELAPRDVVSRSIIMDMKKNDLPCVYLDITFKSRKVLKQRFPQIYETCLKKDIDIAVNWVPVVPAQHYFMGGVKSDLDGKTNIEGLYVCGETACTGVHGANRLASNSLLECLVFGNRCAISINNRSFEKNEYNLDLEEKDEQNFDCQTYRSIIRDYMTKNGGIIRNEKDLKAAIDQICIYNDTLSKAVLTTQKSVETYNMTVVALKILEAAIKREKSIGAHYRSDQKSEDKNVK